MLNTLGKLFSPVQSRKRLWQSTCSVNEITIIKLLYLNTWRVRLLLTQLIGISGTRDQPETFWILGEISTASRCDGCCSHQNVPCRPHLIPDPLQIQQWQIKDNPLGACPMKLKKKILVVLSHWICASFPRGTNHIWKTPMKLQKETAIDPWWGSISQWIEFFLFWIYFN